MVASAFGPISEEEEFEFRKRAEQEKSKMGGKPPLAAFAKQVAPKIWGMMPQNPKNMIQNAPALGGALGAGSPIPGGTMIGTAIGQGVRDIGDKLTKQPIPSGWQHAGEQGLAALSDIMAVPAIKGRIYGKQIGAIERAQGVPPPQDIPSLPKPMAGQPVSGGIDETINAVNRANKQGAGSPVFWKQIKDQIDAFYESGKDLKLGKLDKSKLAWLSGKVQEGLNASVPGREVPAKMLARSQVIPNALKNLSRDIPSKYKVAGAVGGGIGGPLAVAEIIKKLLGGQ